MSQSGFEFIKCKTIAAKSSCVVERFHKQTIGNNRSDSNRLLLRTSQCEFGENFWSAWRMTLGEVPLLLRPHLAVTLFEILNCLSSPWASLLRAMRSGSWFRTRFLVRFGYVTEMHWPRRPGKTGCRQLKRTETMLKSDQPIFLIFPLAFSLSLTLILTLTLSLTFSLTPTLTLDLSP